MQSPAISHSSQCGRHRQLYFNMLFLYLLVLITITRCCGQVIYSNDLYFRVEPGERSCFFESGNIGDMMEVYYQVIDGQHGDLDISLDVTDPIGTKIITDYKKPQNSIIKDLVLDGAYEFCLDNSFSTFNSKMVFIYVMLEGREDDAQEAVVTVVDNEGNEIKQIETLNWEGIDENGQLYYVEVQAIANSLTRTLKSVVKARHMLDMHGASRSRDSYLAFEGIFVVDLWSGFQITVMFIVGMVQVFMIKKLFKNASPY